MAWDAPFKGVYDLPYRVRVKTTKGKWKLQAAFRDQFDAEFFGKALAGLEEAPVCVFKRGRLLKSIPAEVSK